MSSGTLDPAKMMGNWSDFSFDMGLIRERPKCFVHGVCKGDIGLGLGFAAR